jgi:hypothetical protein
MTHAWTNIPTYSSWASMKQRCLNPKNVSYHRYGGRGIKVCERWLTFSNFLEDMGVSPPGMSLDRENNDGDYEPENCRWLPVAENTRRAQAGKPKSVAHVKALMAVVRRDNTTGFRGVQRMANGKFRARFKKQHIGVFHTAEEAADALRMVG